MWESGNVGMWKHPIIRESRNPGIQESGNTGVRERGNSGMRECAKGEGEGEGGGGGEGEGGREREGRGEERIYEGWAEEWIHEGGAGGRKRRDRRKIPINSFQERPAKNHSPCSTLPVAGITTSLWWRTSTSSSGEPTTTANSESESQTWESGTKPRNPGVTPWEFQTDTPRIPYQNSGNSRPKLREFCTETPGIPDQNSGNSGTKDPCIKLESEFNFF